MFMACLTLTETWVSFAQPSQGDVNDTKFVAIAKPEIIVESCDIHLDGLLYLENRMLPHASLILNDTVAAGKSRQFLDTSIPK